MNELFRMNEHGDIWQEPTLFDTPEPVEISTDVFVEHAALLADHHSLDDLDDDVEVPDVPATPPNVDLVETLHVRPHPCHLCYDPNEVCEIPGCTRS